MSLQILRYPDPRLRRPSKLVKSPTDPAIQQLVLEMIKTLRANKGLGLAAPQVGYDLQLCIVELDHELFVLINPEVKKISGKDILLEEGCLSFPGKFLPVFRPEKIKVKAIDINGKKQVIRARGLLARAFQHEIDHLQGELFIDKAETE
jgi:peptide deformylase